MLRQDSALVDQTGDSIIYTYDYPRPSVTVDLALFREKDGSTEVLLIERKHEPFAGSWALPGGFVDEMEDLKPAARRELQEECGLEAGPLVQAGAYGKPGRDPRGHTVSIAFTGTLPADAEPTAGDDAARASWFPLDALPDLAFDHADIVADARRVAAL